MSHRLGREFACLDDAFVSILDLLLRQGSVIAPRAIPTREVTAYSFSINNPRRRYISIRDRKWSIAYAIAELAWHLKGSDSVEEIAFYAPRWRRIAKGNTVTGSSYGARLFRSSDTQASQWQRMLALLSQDAASRRAVLQFAPTGADPLESEADIACALSLQLILRNGRLDAICTMRSNDVLLGLPYDVFLFTTFQEMAATALGCELGRYHHQIGSLHLYDSQLDLAERVVASRPEVSEGMAPMQSVRDVGVLLEGEARCRLGAQPQTTRQQVIGYWSNLLEVLERWTEDRGNDTDGERRTLSDPVLDALYAQWRSTRPRSRTPPPV
jgi:thymidylate synthase